jgi:SAM-dependent methyltransferase
MQSGLNIRGNHNLDTRCRDWYQYAIDSGIENPLPVLRSLFDYNLPLYTKICKHVKAGSRILELGAGTGLFGMWLASVGYRVTQIDLDQRVVALALETAERFNVPKERYSIRVGDANRVARIFSGEMFDLSYSAGLLEHFPEENAIGLLRGMKAVSRKIVSVVPGKHMKVPRLDERPNTMRKLRELHQQAGLKVIESFSFGDEPEWLRLYVPPVIRYALRRYFEIGSDIGVVCV